MPRAMPDTNRASRSRRGSFHRPQPVASSLSPSGWVLVSPASRAARQRLRSPSSAFAVGIPLLPVFGWLGATGDLPIAFLVLIPVAVAAGAALAIANALVDVERDRAAGSGSIALAIGPANAWLIHVGLLVAIGLGAVASVGPLGGSIGGGTTVALAAILPVGAGLAARGGGVTRRERAWELEAVGVAVLALAWLLAVRS